MDKLIHKLLPTTKIAIKGGNITLDRRRSSLQPPLPKDFDLPVHSSSIDTIAKSVSTHELSDDLLIPRSESVDGDISIKRRGSRNLSGNFQSGFSGSLSQINKSKNLVMEISFSIMLHV